MLPPPRRGLTPSIILGERGQDLDRKCPQSWHFLVTTMAHFLCFVMNKRIHKYGQTDLLVEIVIY